MESFLKDRITFFKEGKVVIKDEIIILKDITVVTHPEVKIIITPKEDKFIKESKDFHIKTFNIKDIEKLINKEFTMNLEDCDLTGCKLNSSAVINVSQISGVYKSLIYF